MNYAFRGGRPDIASNDDGIEGVCFGCRQRFDSRYSAMNVREYKYELHRLMTDPFAYLAKDHGAPSG